MAISSIADVFDAPAYVEASETMLRDTTALMSSAFMSSGIVEMSPTMPWQSESKMGKTIGVPGFTLIGPFTNITDGNDAPIRKLTNYEDDGILYHAANAVNITEWANSGAAASGRSLAEVATEQLKMRLEELFDQQALGAAVNETGLPASQIVDYSSSTITRNLILRGRDAFRDRANLITGVVMHSRVASQLIEAVDGVGRTLYSDLKSVVGNSLNVVETSDRVPVSASASSYTVESFGTTPPAITLTGTANRFVKLKVVCTTLGARGTAVVKYSTDGGDTWIENVTTAASWTVKDTASAVEGVYEETGLTINYANASAAVDNYWITTGNHTVSTVLLGKRAVGIWYSASRAGMQTYHDVLKNADMLAHHVYYVPVRRNHMIGNVKRPMVSVLKTKVVY